MPIQSGIVACEASALGAGNDIPKLTDHKVTVVSRPRQAQAKGALTT